MTREDYIKNLQSMIDDAEDMGLYDEDIESLQFAIKSLGQELRDCKTCIHSDKGKCAGTEECHLCMWESQYEQEPCEDCISRQMIIDGINRYFHDEYYQRTSIQDCMDCLIEDVIKPLPSVTPKPKTDALDKIRAEIEERIKVNQCLNTDRANALCWCLEIIDKYKAESEE